MGKRKVVIYPGVPSDIAATIIDSWRERHENDEERTSKGVRFVFNGDRGSYYAYQTKTQIVIKPCSKGFMEWANASNMI